MSQPSKFSLAASVLNDANIVSYRSLGRELKVHSNVAKKCGKSRPFENEIAEPLLRMLYEFYSTQGTKTPESINATYLLDGVPRAPKQSCVNGHQQSEEDTHMQSSPYMSSSVPPQEDQEAAIPSRSIILVREEDLEPAKARFKQINSIHVYSLGPSRVQNLQILSDCNRAMSVKYADEDPLVFRERYGVIHNAGVKRRTGKRPPSGVPPISAINDKASSKSLDINKKQKNAVQPFEGSSSSDKSIKSTSKAIVTPETKVEGPTNVEKKPTSTRSAAKRESSEILKSFSRPRASLMHDDTGILTGASPALGAAPSKPKSVQEDETMKDTSEDEQDDDFMASNSVNPRVSKSQSERAEQLRKMMEDENEEMEDTADDAPNISQVSGPVDGSTSQKDTFVEPPIVVTGGRRRGRRKVMKKKTMKDEEGYLVTKEEPAWESFSEDEPPEKQKTLASTAIMGKGKKSGGRPGQGNIMSFFGKK